VEGGATDGILTKSGSACCEAASQLEGAILSDGVVSWKLSTFQGSRMTLNIDGNEPLGKTWTGRISEIGDEGKEEICRVGALG